MDVTLPMTLVKSTLNVLAGFGPLLALVDIVRKSTTLRLANASTNATFSAYSRK